jgi:cytosine/adenosine deaminase-related metal-dependent hydrolase
MITLLIRNIHTLITLNADRQQIKDGSIYVRGNTIEFVGATSDLPIDLPKPDRVINADRLIVMPGMVNTHHHLYQTLTRCMAVDSGLFNWLKTLYPIWARMDAEAVYTSALTGMAELILSGCTTSSDHLYLFPNGSKLDDEIRAAQEIGLRFHAARGSMSLGESKGGLPPDSVVDDEQTILKDCIRVIEQYHDPKPGAMIRIVVAPCSPFSVTENLMRESAALARQYGVQLHTHLAETFDEDDFCKQMFGVLPVEYAEQTNWLGDDVWYAHSVHVREQDIELMAQTQTGAAHCPSSNMRLASGIAPIRSMIDHGVPVGLGVDGSASNDGSHMLAEARQAMLLQRVSGNSAGLTGLEALELATLGGAKVLGRADVGSIEVGKCADFIGFDIDRLEYAGAQHDPQAALIFCAPQRVDLSVINGKIVVEDGELRTIDVGKVIENHNKISMKLING